MLFRFLLLRMPLTVLTFSLLMLQVGSYFAFFVLVIGWGFSVNILVNLIVFVGVDECDSAALQGGLGFREFSFEGQHVARGFKLRVDGWQLADCFGHYLPVSDDFGSRQVGECIAVSFDFRKILCDTVGNRLVLNVVHA